MGSRLPKCPSCGGRGWFDNPDDVLDQFKCQDCDDLGRRELPALRDGFAWHSLRWGRAWHLRSAFEVCSLVGGVSRVDGNWTWWSRATKGRRVQADSEWDALVSLVESTKAAP